ncbi:hypothetical protein IW140_005088 [Coemansia sp. RSA 1813]|nr:hypothetical protein EV178_005103 [Coemansia sp. RSA 1646]KAJ1768309.1 hypothetical protein LPJ74_004907 [Coemansia sp. RSA 1843]KAJ2089063.1 hypothetical protein IW138_003775 [Coemansia sp. RSA 986]KAJ2212025.1 hypothetical protein EV179_005011 [Coemansia sp. RSA 487]KAJ2566046.1 hypothetical protein IW140_005088 [Coemansia sp. RSA 1813]
MTHTVAVIGATGLQGGSVLRSLHATKKYSLIAVTRNISSASTNKLKTEYLDVKLVATNVNGIGSLKKAFVGANYVFGMITPALPVMQEQTVATDIDAEFNQGKNITDAATVASVENIVFSTLYLIKDLSNGKYQDVLHFKKKHEIEKYIRPKAAEIRGAFIQLGFFMENFVTYSRILPEDNKTVEFILPLKPTTKVPLVDTANDAGGVVSYVLDHFDHFVGKTVEVSGGYYEAQEMAKAFTEATGKPARFVQLPYETLNNEDMEQIFKAHDEFGYFGWKTDFWKPIKS